MMMIQATSEKDPSQSSSDLDQRSLRVVKNYSKHVGSANKLGSSTGRAKTYDGDESSSDTQCDEQTRQRTCIESRARQSLEHRAEFRERKGELASPNHPAHPFYDPLLLDLVHTVDCVVGSGIVRLFGYERLDESEQNRDDDRSFDRLTQSLHT